LLLFLPGYSRYNAATLFYNALNASAIVEDEEKSGRCLLGFVNSRSRYGKFEAKFLSPYPAR